MKIYRLEYYEASAEHGDDGTALFWASSKRGCEQELAQRRRDGRVADSGPISVTPFDIEPTRAGILQWLNVNFTTNNG